MTNDQEHHAPAVDSDRELLDRFARRGDEEAFRALVDRHAALVLGVCRRVLRHAQDAEDAWQATFLVLIEKASALRVQRTLANWLYGVAFRIAVRARSKKYRKTETETLTDVTSKEPDVFAQVASAYEQQLLDEELYGMPGKYREPLVLHYLLGKTAKGVALHLGLTERTVEGRLRRGKQELRQRLAKRGIRFGALISAAILTQEESQAAIDRLNVSNIAATSGIRSEPAIVALAKQELGHMTFHRLGLISAIAATFVLAGTVVTLSMLRGQTRAGSALSDVTQLATTPPAGPTGADAPTFQAAGPRNIPDRDPFDAPEPSPSASESSVDNHDPFSDVGSGQSPVDDATSFGDDDTAGDGSAEPLSSNMANRNKRNTRATILPLLDKRSNVDFIESPLTDVLAYFRAWHDVNIVLDPRAIENLKLNPDETPVSLQLRDVTFKYALRQILEPHGLDFVVESEAITITTKEEN